MMDRLADRLNELAVLPPAALRAEWRRLYHAPAPGLSPDLLVRGIAWRIQAKQHGGLSPGTERELEKLAMPVTSASPTSAPPATRLRPGTRLVRSWNGETYSVLVTDDGYCFNDRTYTSLSSIAKTITGTKWSGPRFFGLKGAAPTKGGRNAKR